MTLSKTYQPIPRNDLLQLWLAVQNVQRGLDQRIDVERMHQKARKRRGRDAAYVEGKATLDKYNEQYWRLCLLKAELFILRDLSK
jgi:hypothetical protein